MIAISVAVMMLSLQLRRVWQKRIGAWNTTVWVGVAFIVVTAAIEVALPAVNEVPATFPATLLWQFRIASLGMQAILWITIGPLLRA